jgi:NAD-dependent deacetylase
MKLRLTTNLILSERTVWEGTRTMRDDPAERAPRLDKWEEEIRRVAELISATDKAVALTGAGISVDSGIPAFRGAQGLWEKYDPAEYAHIDAFLTDPKKVWVMLEEMAGIVMTAQPNPGHRGLAELERMGHLMAVITQNVDNLHQRAGNQNVIEFHGNGSRLVCLRCGRRYSVEETEFTEFPPHCQCSMILKPDVIFFGELIPAEASQRAEEAAVNCSLMLVIGTSAMVWPASEIPRVARDHNAQIVEINVEKTELTGRIADHHIGESASVVLPAIVAEVERLRKQAS